MSKAVSWPQEYIPDFINKLKKITNAITQFSLFFFCKLIWCFSNPSSQPSTHIAQPHTRSRLENHIWNFNALLYITLTFFKNVLSWLPGSAWKVALGGVESVLIAQLYPQLEQMFSLSPGCPAVHLCLPLRRGKDMVHGQQVQDTGPDGGGPGGGPHDGADFRQNLYHW